MYSLPIERPTMTHVGGFKVYITNSVLLGKMLNHLHTNWTQYEQFAYLHTSIGKRSGVEEA